MNSLSFEKFFLSSEENLNQCVDGLFTKDKNEPHQKIKSIIRYNPPNRVDKVLNYSQRSNDEGDKDDSKGKGKRRRQRKNL